MSINTESLASVNKATSDFLLSAANTALGSSERFANLNIDTTRSVFENSVSKAKALMDAKDLQEAIAIQGQRNFFSVKIFRRVHRDGNLSLSG